MPQSISNTFTHSVICHFPISHLTNNLTTYFTVIVIKERMKFDGHQALTLQATYAPYCRVAYVRGGVHNASPYFTTFNSLTSKITT